MVRPLGLMILFGGLLATLAFFLGALGLRLRRARLTITTVKRSHVQSFGNAVAALVPLASIGFQVVTRKNRLCFLLCRAICPLPASTTLKRSESQFFGKAFTFLLQQVYMACLLFIRRKRLWTLQ